MQSTQYKEHSLQTEPQQLEYNVPRGSCLCSSYLNQALARASLEQFVVACDKIENSGSKIFAVYDNPHIFYKALLQEPKENRCSYEVIRQNSACKLHFDVEWEGAEDSTHETVKEFIRFLRAYFAKFLGCEQKLEIYVLRGSRNGKGGIFKNSYHIVSPSIMFCRNHDGRMKEFVSELSRNENLKKFRYEHNGKDKSYVDTSIYTINRCFRLPHCCKKGTDVPFERISGNPFDEDDSFTSKYDPAEEESWLPFILTGSEDRAIIYFKEREASQEKSRVKRPLSTPGEDPGGKRPKFENTLAAGDIQLPVPMKHIQTALAKSGDQVSRVSNVTLKQGNDGLDVWQIQCCQRGQRRSCLHDSEVTHDSNNCILFIQPDPNSLSTNRKFTMRYHCTSSRCKHKQLTLGVFQQQGQEWDYIANGCPGLLDQPLQESQQERSRQSQEQHSGTECGSSQTERLKVSQINTDDPADNQYDAVKKRFEQTTFKIRIPFAYGREESSGYGDSETKELCILKHAELQQFFCHVHYYEKREAEYRDEEQRKSSRMRSEWVKKPFINRWLRDQNKREVSTVDIDPTCSRTDIYNLWSGYIAAKVKLSLEFDGHRFPDEESAKQFAVNPIRRHITEVVTRGDVSHTEYLLDWMAQIVQKPHQRTEVAISLFGDQGSGKGIIFEWLRKHVLGEKHTFQTSKPERELFDRFSLGLVNKTLVQVDEVKSLHDHADNLKDAITNATVNFEKKGKDTITVRALANFVFTSNNENALKVATDDRRMVLFRCDSKYKGNTEYFTGLNQHLNNSQVSGWFYKFLMDRDLSKYPNPSFFQANRPITEYYQECQNASIPPLRLFLSAFVNGDLPSCQTSKDLFNMYVDWIKKQNFSYNPNQITFGREMGRLAKEDEGAVKARKFPTHNAYNIDKQRLKEFLQRKKQYDESVSTFD